VVAALHRPAAAEALRDCAHGARRRGVPVEWRHGASNHVPPACVPAARATRPIREIVRWGWHHQRAVGAERAIQRRDHRDRAADNPAQLTQRAMDKPMSSRLDAECAR